MSEFTYFERQFGIIFNNENQEVFIGFGDDNHDITHLEELIDDIDQDYSDLSLNQFVIVEILQYDDYTDQHPETKPMASIEHSYSEIGMIDLDDFEEVSDIAENDPDDFNDLYFGALDKFGLVQAEHFLED